MSKMQESTTEMDTDSSNVYGGCEGPQSMYIKLVSSDGFEFVIKREYTLASNVIQAMLNGPYQYDENETNVVYLRDIPSYALQRICEFLTFKAHFNSESTENPDFPIRPEIILELLVASNFLNC